MADLSDRWQVMVQQLTSHQAVEKRKSLSVFYCFKAGVSSWRMPGILPRKKPFVKKICTFGQENFHSVLLADI